MNLAINSGVCRFSTWQQQQTSVFTALSLKGRLENCTLVASAASLEEHSIGCLGYPELEDSANVGTCLSVLKSSVNDETALVFLVTCHIRTFLCYYIMQLEHVIFPYPDTQPFFSLPIIQLVSFVPTNSLCLGWLPPKSV